MNRGTDSRNPIRYTGCSQSVLLIGGNGFIGTHVADMLVREGHRVTVLDRSACRSVNADACRHFQGELTDKGLLDRALQGVDSVVHLAGSGTPGTSGQDPEEDIRRNLLPLFPLLEAMRARKVSRLVYFSSGGAIYSGQSAAPFRELTPLGPRTSYGVLKVAAEHYLQIEARNSGLRLTIMRPSNPFGPYQNKIGVQGVIGTMLWRVARQEPIEIWGDGTVRRDYVYVTDVAGFCVSALARDITGVFNVGSGKAHSLNEVIATICGVTGTLPDVRYMPGRACDAPLNWLDCSAAERETGWTAQFGLEDGIARTWDWVRGDA